MAKEKYSKFNVKKDITRKTNIEFVHTDSESKIKSKHYEVFNPVTDMLKMMN